MRTRASALVRYVAAAVAVGLAALLTSWLWPRETGQPATSVGPITLFSHTGETVSRESVAGQPYLVHFGYTNCPDICPTIMAELGKVLTLLGPAADQVQIFFVTVDPERDTPAVLAAYVAHFDPRIVGLWGYRAEIIAFIRSFGASAGRIRQPDGSYQFEHTSDLILVDAAGRIAERLPALVSADQLAMKLMALLDKAAPRETMHSRDTLRPAAAIQ